MVVPGVPPIARCTNPVEKNINQTNTGRNLVCLSDYLQQRILEMEAKNLKFAEAVNVGCPKSKTRASWSISQAQLRLKRITFEQATKKEIEIAKSRFPLATKQATKKWEDTISAELQEPYNTADAHNKNGSLSPQDKVLYEGVHKFTIATLSSSGNSINSVQQLVDKLNEELAVECDEDEERRGFTRQQWSHMYYKVKSVRLNPSARSFLVKKLKGLGHLHDDSNLQTNAESQSSLSPMIEEGPSHGAIHDGLLLGGAAARYATLKSVPLETLMRNCRDESKSSCFSVVKWRSLVRGDTTGWSASALQWLKEELSRHRVNYELNEIDLEFCLRVARFHQSCLEKKGLESPEKDSERNIANVVAWVNAKTCSGGELPGTDAKKKLPFTAEMWSSIIKCKRFTLPVNLRSWLDQLMQWDYFNMLNPAATIDYPVLPLSAFSPPRKRTSTTKVQRRKANSVESLRSGKSAATRTVQKKRKVCFYHIVYLFSRRTSSPFTAPSSLNYRVIHILVE
jgi:hypothetical protein